MDGLVILSATLALRTQHSTHRIAKRSRAEHSTALPQHLFFLCFMFLVGWLGGFMVGGFPGVD